MSTCRGVDVSAYQAVQDWAAWKRAGVVFAFAKASEGEHTHDPRFATHISGIIAAGLLPGGYHFAWPVQDPVTEAANYIGAVNVHANAHDFVHWLDLERYSDGRNYGSRSAAQIRAWVTTWIARVQAAFPRQRVGVYTSADDLAKGHVPAGVPLWYPAYPGTSVDTYAEAEGRPQPAPSGRHALIWQFTSDPAGPARIDESIAYMSGAAFRAWAQGATPQEDDVALTKTDVETLADTDGVFLAPADASDYSADESSPKHYWSLGSHVADNTSRIRRVDKAVAVMTAQLAALTATVGALAQGGGLTAVEVQAAAEAGAKAALEQLAEKIQED